jgi:hypothetical protein
MDTDPIDALNQSLKAAGIHPSQIDPVMLTAPAAGGVQLDIPAPLVHFVYAATPDEQAAFARRLAD